MPKAHSSHYENIPKPGVDDLGGTLRTVLEKLEKALDNPPYNYIIHTAPFDHQELPHYHWHIEIIPRLTKVAGFEWGSGFYINPMPARGRRRVPPRRLGRRPCRPPSKSDWIGPESAGILMSPEEFDAIEEYDELYRYELIRGVLVVTAVPLEEEAHPNETLGGLLGHLSRGSIRSARRSTSRSRSGTFTSLRVAGGPIA